MQIFHAPPDEVILRNDSILSGSVKIVDRIHSMLLIVDLSSAETDIGANHQCLGIAGIVENIGQAGDTGQKRFSRRTILVHILCRGLQRDTCCLGNHGADGPGGTLGGVKSTDFSVAVREAEILICQIIELGDQIFIHGAAQIP